MNTNLKEEILRQTDSGRLVFAYYLGEDYRPKKKFRNPFYDDTKPSCNIFFDTKSHQYIFKDFGDESYKGDCFWFVSVKKNLNLKSDFFQILKCIIEDLHLHIFIDSTYNVSNINIGLPNPTPISPQGKKEKAAPKRYAFEEQPFTEQDFLFWGRYGITPETLARYDVVALKSFEIHGEHGVVSYVYKATSPMYGYKGDGFIKTYRPKEQNRFLFGGNKPSTYCFGLELLPTRGDMLFITGGEKDVLSLSSHGLNAICFNSETATIPESMIEMLHNRFKHLFVMFDMDETGRKSMKSAVEKLSAYNVLPLHLPLSGEKVEKDISDFFALGKTEADLHELVIDQLDSLYSQSLILIKTCEMDYKHPPTPSKVVVSSAEVPIGTYDNLFCVTGGEGTGKSNFISTLIAGTLFTSEKHSKIDTLGMDITPNISSKAILHFDTEQSEPQLHKNMTMTLNRAGLDEMPPFYHSFYMVALSRKDRMKLIRDSMDLFHHQHGGIHLVVIDGVADLIRSANDEAESTSVVEELYRLAGMYHTCVIVVLHFTPHGFKLRGHIGSELQRKSASIISIEKDDNPVYSVVKAIKVRDGNPLDMPMTMFSWDKQKGMFVSAGQKSQEDTKKRKFDKLTKVASVLFKKQDLYSYTSLTVAIITELDCANRTAKDYINYMVTEGIIAKNGSNMYALADND